MVNCLLTPQGICPYRVLRVDPDDLDRPILLRWRAREGKQVSTAANGRPVRHVRMREIHGGWSVNVNSAVGRPAAIHQANGSNAL